jgi:Fe2+ or Zn2+ uptake regulation protein
MVESRVTRQKRILDDSIKQLTKNFNAEELLLLVQKDDKKIGIATIYRYLKDLRKTNSIYSYTCEGKTIYSNSKKTHCHFIDEISGEVIHFDIDNLDFLNGKVKGDINSISIEVKGNLK